MLRFLVNLNYCDYRTAGWTQNYTAGSKIVRKFLNKTNWDEGVKQFLDNICYVGLHFVLIMIVLGKFGITASSVIAVIGSVGLSVGLALQGTLSNFAGGVLILILKPFKVGDYIREDTHGTKELFQRSSSVIRNC